MRIAEKFVYCLIFFGVLTSSPHDAHALEATRIITRPGEIVMLANQEYYDALIERIRTAKKRIEIAMFLFKTGHSPNNRPTNILDELVSAKKRGVSVLVVLEKSNQDDDLNTENTRSYKMLRKYGIDTFFETPKTTTHTKLVVIDGRYCFVGSHNFTNSALSYNNELSLLVDNETLAHDISTYIKGLLEKK